MKLSKAEIELIELVRSAGPCCTFLARPECGGEWAISVAHCSPAECASDASKVLAGVGATFAEAWASRARAMTGAKGN